jgi:hypothetical protein
MGHGGGFGGGGFGRGSFGGGGFAGGGGVAHSFAAPGIAGRSFASPGIAGRSFAALAIAGRNFAGVAAGRPFVGQSFRHGFHGRHFARRFVVPFGLGLGYGAYGYYDDTCYAWTPYGYTWICGYDY